MNEGSNFVVGSTYKTRLRVVAWPKQNLSINPGDIFTVLGIDYESGYFITLETKKYIIPKYKILLSKKEAQEHVTTIGALSHYNSSKKMTLWTGFSDEARKHFNLFELKSDLEKRYNKNVSNPKKAYVKPVPHLFKRII